MGKEEAPAWTCIHLLKGAVEFGSSFGSSGKDPVIEKREGEPVDVLAAWKEDVPLSDHVGLSLRASDVMFMILDLPTQVESEIGPMVELQAEDLSPFPPERTQVAWELLGPVESGGSRVLLVILPLQKLEDLHRTVEPLLGTPVRIDVDVLGWLNVLSEESAFPRGKDAWMLLLDEEEAVLVAWHHTTPVLIRSLGPREELSEDILLEELQQARIPVETAFPEASLQEMIVWHQGPEPDWKGGGSGLPNMQLLSLDSPLNAMRGVLNRCEDPSTLDCTPLQWKRQLEQKKRTRKLLRTAGTLVGIWAIGLGALLTWSFVRQVRVENLEEENLRNQSSVSDVRELNDQVRSLSQFTDRSQSALEVLRILAEAVPSSGALEMRSFEFKKTSGQVFSGSMGDNLQPFNRFLDALTASNQLEVEDYNLDKSPRGYGFRIETNWKWEDSP